MKSTSTKSSATKSSASPKRPRRGKAFPLRPHPHLYEINTWVWLDELTLRQGGRISLGSVPDAEWDQLKELGFDVIYLMGIWKRSPLGRLLSRTDRDLFSSYNQALPSWQIEDVVGSGYSIQDYVPEPHLGTWKELKSVQQKLHARGMALMVDFVPNHTGLDHPWITSHPEYYVQGTLEDFRGNPSAFLLVEDPKSTSAPLFIARGRDPNFAPWADTAQLNYFNPALCKAMINVLKKISRAADAVRCDMAMLEISDIFQGTWKSLLSAWSRPAEEFWKVAIEAVPALLFMAEAYSATEFQLQGLGFNFTYDKGLYDELRDHHIQQVFQHLKGGWGYQSKSARFLENHDEPCCHQVFGAARMPAVAALMASVPGLRFYHQGQLEGKTMRIPVQLARAQRGPSHSDIQHMYEKLLTVTNQPAYHSDNWRLLPVQSGGDGSFQSLIAYSWRAAAKVASANTAGTKTAAAESKKAPPEFKLVVVNLSQEVGLGRVALEQDLSESSQWEFSDELNGQTYVRDSQEIALQGLFVRLEPSAAHMFSVRSAEAGKSAKADSAVSG